MDAYNDPTIREIVFIKPTQVGGTEAMHNMLGYIIDQCPAPSMVVYPNDELAKSSGENRIKPMAKDTPVLKEKFNERKSKQKELKFTGMTLYMATAGSATDLASKPIKNLFLDEIDKINFELKDEGDVVELAEERVKTYMNHKIFKTSTPTNKNGRIWKAMRSADVLKKPRVTCPHCNSSIELLWNNLKYETNEEKTDVKNVMYMCQECNCAITEQQRFALLRTVHWEIVSQNRERVESVAFWMNTLYSPFVTWEQMAMKWLKAQGDPQKLQNFVNSWLGEPWTDSVTELDEEVVLNSQTDVPRAVVPSWAEVLTGGVDVQQNSLYYTIKAWGAHMTAQTIEHGEVLSFEDIETAMNLEYKKADGSGYFVSLCCVDSGDRTDEVYEFCMMNEEWAVAVKGASQALLGYYRISKIDKDGSTANGKVLINVDTNKYKDLIASRYKRENGANSGAFMVYKGCDVRYANQVTAEHKVPDKRNRSKVTWQKKSGRENHYLDTEVYACVAADVIGVRNLHLQMEEPETHPTIQPKKPQNNWIQGGSY